MPRKAGRTGGYLSKDNQLITGKEPSRTDQRCYFRTGQDFRKTHLIQANAFDFVVTVALGSRLSAVILQEFVALAEGAAALALLIFFQFTVTF